ncbi:MAG: DnaJ domain-containing protein [Oceanobacter sp.]
MANYAYNNEQWVIWNGFYGLATLVALGDIEEDELGVWAWLDDPFDMVGPFDLDELKTTGCIAFEECLVMSPQYWLHAEARLRMEGMVRRRAAEEQLRHRAHFGGSQQSEQWQFNGQPSAPSLADDKQHRAALHLPSTGKLEVVQIKSAFRKLAQKHHPDVGGDTETFQRITRARDFLLAS